MRPVVSCTFLWLVSAVVWNAANAMRVSSRPLNAITMVLMTTAATP